MEGSREIHRTKTNDSNTGAGQPIIFEPTLPFKMNAQIGKENAIYKIITSRLFIHHQYQYPIYGLQEHPDPSSQYTCEYRDNSHINQVHSTN